jgi:hypothetical protein
VVTNSWIRLQNTTLVKFVQRANAHLSISITEEGMIRRCSDDCQFLVLAITTGKKKFQSSVWRVVDYDLKKKSSSRLSGSISKNENYELCIYAGFFVTT